MTSTAPSVCNATSLFSSCSPATVFLDQQGGFIGSRYKKVVYKQFTNDRFNTEVQRDADTEHLGIMGGKQKQRNKLSNVIFIFSISGKVFDFFFFFVICDFFYFSAFGHR